MRQSSLNATWTWLAGLVLLASCAGGLEDPDRFTGSLTCPDGFDVETQLLQVSCGISGCHAGPAPEAALDLESPDARARLVQAQATSSCAGEPLIDAANPTASVLYRKVSGTECGTQMPASGNLLSAAEVDCIRLWMAQTSTTT